MRFVSRLGDLVRRVCRRRDSRPTDQAVDDLRLVITHAWVNQAGSRGLRSRDITRALRYQPHMRRLAAAYACRSGPRSSVLLETLLIGVGSSCRHRVVGPSWG